MTKSLIFSIFITFLFTAYSINAQENRLVSLDLLNGTIDTLAYVDFDRGIRAENTDFYIGNYSNTIIPLDISTPKEHLPNPMAKFTYKQRATDYFDLSEFPVRTSIQLLRMVNGEFRKKCSGSLISPKHVLTACHCIVNTQTGSFLQDSLFVAPVLDNGEFSSKFKASQVSKIYKFEYSGLSNDLALLELSEPIGSQTGWLGIGFDNDSKVFDDGVFYKFSYPATTWTEVDPHSYNGDTLYFNYGHVSYYTQSTLFLHYLTGIPGESGSSLIHIKNGETYTTYGALSTSYDLHHARIQDFSYFALKSVIEPYLSDLSFRTNNWNVKADFNSMTNIFSYELPTEKDIRIQVYNLQGIKQYESNIYKTVFGEIDLSILRSGTHILFITSGEAKHSFKFMKY